MSKKINSRTLFGSALTGSVLFFGASISLTGCAQLKNRFDLFAPISPETAAAKLSKDGTYRDEYGIVHAYKDQAGMDQPISELLSVPLPLGGTK